ncbi:putative glucosamine-fructose-6-phosphate aminotransferase [Clostridiaceae bacterium JG1575]|nr:putative glucosamine-fructose-6-phosphate aminotransferase [Clostridiaceae bacterium JG1575]
MERDESQPWANLQGALALRRQVEDVVDAFYEEGLDALVLLGIGGTYASALQTEVYLRGKTKLPVIVAHAAEYCTHGTLRITKDSVVLFSSVTGTTEEMVAACQRLKALGCRLFGFVDVPDSPLAPYCTNCISYPKNEQLKLFMVANRFLFLEGAFPDYEHYNAVLEEFLARDLLAVEERADPFAQRFAADKYAHSLKHPEMPHYFIAAGTHFGAAYSYAMCYFEEQHWLRARCLHSSEFFHGALEIVDADTPVTVFIGEDESRPLSLRAAAFLPKITRHLTIIDTKDYPLPGIPSDYRASLSHHILRAVNNRIDVHLEREFRHPMDIRRYYRRLPY